MIVYRICLSQYSAALIASGNPARWNSKDTKVIYTAESRALACLENVVHRNSKGLEKNFSQMNIEIPNTIKMEKIKIHDLKSDWKEFMNMSYTQSLGNEWIRAGETAVLKVPSAIVAGDSNYLLNPLHQDFKKIKLLMTLPFQFDTRIKI
jgi:RES domain-containing protein